MKKNIIVSFDEDTIKKISFLLYKKEYNQRRRSHLIRDLIDLEVIKYPEYNDAVSYGNNGVSSKFSAVDMKWLEDNAKRFPEDTRTYRELKEEIDNRNGALRMKELISL